MRGIAVGVCVLLTLTFAVAIPAAGDEQRAGTSAVRLLETLTVPAVAGAPVTTRTSLRKGARYRLVVTGTVTGTFTNPSGVTVGEREDAFYCYEEINEAAVDPASSCTRNIRYLGALRWRNGNFNDSVENALGLKTQIAYQPSHRYSLNFQAPRSGKLGFVSSKLPALSPTGSFELNLSGVKAKKKPKKRKKRKKRRWFVSFKVTHSGDASDSFPATNPGWVKNETTATGRVYFKDKPKRGRKSVGRAVRTTFVHTDTYQSPINPFSFTEGEVRASLGRAVYQQLSGEFRLDFNEGVVTAVSGDVYSTDQFGNSIQARDDAAIFIKSDLPAHRDDLLKVAFTCPYRCKDRGGYHTHILRVARYSKLRVTISPPKPL